MRTAPSPRPVSISELPPHLRPMAVLTAAPRTERRLPVLGALVIYGLMPLGLVAMDRFAPEVRLQPPTKPEWVQDLVLDPPSSGGPAKALSAPPVPPAPPLRGEDVPKIPAIEPSPEAIPDTPDRLPDGPPIHGDLHRNEGGTGIGDPNAPHSNLPYNPNPSPHSNGTGPVNFEATGLRILKQVEPRYPAPARMARISGDVVLRMLVDEQGAPVKADVVSGHGMLAGEATRAAMQWRFEAARVGIHPVKATFLLTLKFRLV